MSKYTTRPIEALGRVARQWLMISLVVDAVLIAWSVGDVLVLSNADSLPPEMVDFWALTGLVGFAQIITFVVCIVIVARWIYRACANVHAMGARIETSPPWSVGWYFIPFANLWMPFKAMREIWTASVPQHLRIRDDHSRLLGLWWAGWIVSNIAGNISFRLSMSSPENTGLIASSAFAILSGVGSVLATLMLRRIIQAITEGQTGQSVADVF